MEFNLNFDKEQFQIHFKRRLKSHSLLYYGMKRAIYWNRESYTDFPRLCVLDDILLSLVFSSEVNDGSTSGRTLTSVTSPLKGTPCKHNEDRRPNVRKKHFCCRCFHFVLFSWGKEVMEAAIEKEEKGSLLSPLLSCLHLC